MHYNQDSLKDVKAYCNFVEQSISSSSGDLGKESYAPIFLFCSDKSALTNKNRSCRNQKIIITKQ